MVDDDEPAIAEREPVQRTPEQVATIATLRAEASASAPRSGQAADGAITVEGLTKRFGPRTALSDVSFSVGWGEVFGLLGPNGAGKTTTVRTLGTLIAPTAGSAVVAGIPLRPENAVAIRGRIAIMPEAPGLYPRLTVAENLEFFAGLYGLADVRPRIERALATVSLADRAGDLCASLSKGLKQRVAIARALLSDPRVLFLDEPTSGLDPVASREVHELIAALRERGVTIVLTTHRLDEAERMCDRVAILNTTLRTVGRPDELRERLFAHVAGDYHGRPAGCPRARVRRRPRRGRLAAGRRRRLRAEGVRSACRRARADQGARRRGRGRAHDRRTPALARGRLPGADR